MRLRSGRCCGQSADPLGERRPKTTVLAEWVCTLADSLSGVACCPDRFPAAAWPVLLGRAAVCAGGRRPARETATREAARSGRSRSPARPSGPSGALHTGGACGAVCGGASSRCPAGPAAASYRSGRVVCVLPGLVLCGIRGACAEHEEARDCCRQNERADAYVHKGAGCLSDEESLKQPGQQEETEEAPHASCCACHQLL